MKISNDMTTTGSPPPDVMVRFLENATLSETTLNETNYLHYIFIRFYFHLISVHYSMWSIAYLVFRLESTNSFKDR